MKNYISIFISILLIILLNSCSSTRQIPSAFRELKNGEKISLCRTELLGGVNTSNFFGISGMIADKIKNEADRPYYQALMSAIDSIYQDSLNNTHYFSYVNSKDINRVKDDNILSDADIAKNNQLSICVFASSAMRIGFGWNKHLVLWTKWQLTGSTGWTTTIETEVESNNTYGVFPDVGDPSLRDGWVETAKESVKQFKYQISEMITESKKLSAQK